MAANAEKLLAAGAKSWYKDDPSSPSGRAYFDLLYQLVATVIVLKMLARQAAPAAIVELPEEELSARAARQIFPSCSLCGVWLCPRRSGRGIP